jgi:hypothetical protein
MIDILDDSANVTVTDPATRRVRVGTLVWVVDHWRVIFYAPYYIEVKVTDLSTVETIQSGNADPLVNRLMNEHRAAAPDDDLVEPSAASAA